MSITGWMESVLKKIERKMINTHWGGVVEDNSFWNT